MTEWVIMLKTNTDKRSFNSIMKEKKTFLGWLDNFWYHYKWWTIFAAFLLVVIGSGIYFAVTDTKYDYNISYVTYSPISVTQMDEFQKEITKYAKDTNGNGKVDVNVQFYNMGIIDDDINGYVGNMVNLQDDINHARSTIFVLDEKAFNFIQENYKCFGNQDGTYADASMDLEKLGWNWSGTAIYGKMKYYGFPDNLYFVVRTIDNTKFSGQKKPEQSSDSSLIMLEKIKTENPHDNKK